MDAENEKATSSGASTLRTALTLIGGLAVLLVGCMLLPFLTLRIYEMVAGPSVCDEEVYPLGEPLEPERALYLGGNLELLGQFGGGNADDLVLRDSIAYVKMGRELTQLDLTDPGNPLQRGSSFFGKEYRLLHVHASRPEATVLVDNALWWVDFSEPQAPSAKNLYYARADVQDARILGHRAYLSVARCEYNEFSFELCRDGLHVVDVTGGAFSAAPQRCTQDVLADIESLWISRTLPESAMGRASIGEYDVVAAGSEGVQIYKLDASGSRSKVGEYKPPSNLTEVVSAGQHAFVVEHGGPLYVLDLSDPTSPEKVGEYADHLGLSHLRLDNGSTLHALVEGRELYIALDVSTPIYPTLIQTITSATRYLDLKIDDERVLLLQVGSGIVILDGEHEALVELDGFGSATHFDVQGNLIYVLIDKGAEGGAVLVLDVTSSSDPKLLSEIHLEDPQALAVSGSALFLLDQRRFKTFDVSDPAAPILVRDKEERRAQALKVDGDTLFFQSDTATLRINDITDPFEPTTRAIFAGSTLIEEVDENPPLILLTNGRLLILRVGPEPSAS